MASNVAKSTLLGVQLLVHVGPNTTLESDHSHFELSDALLLLGHLTAGLDADPFLFLGLPLSPKVRQPRLEFDPIRCG